MRCAECFPYSTYFGGSCSSAVPDSAYKQIRQSSENGSANHLEGGETADSLTSNGRLEAFKNLTISPWCWNVQVCQCIFKLPCLNTKSQSQAKTEKLAIGEKVAAYWKLGEFFSAGYGDHNNCFLEIEFPSFTGYTSPILRCIPFANVNNFAFIVF